MNTKREMFKDEHRSIQALQAPIFMTSSYEELQYAIALCLPKIEKLQLDPHGLKLIQLTRINSAPLKLI